MRSAPVPAVKERHYMTLIYTSLHVMQDYRHISYKIIIIIIIIIINDSYNNTL